MKNKKFLSILSATLLGLAIFKMPYEFYTILRIIVTASALYLAFQETKERSNLSFSVIILWGLAILFNPIYTIHFSALIWKFIDGFGALFFIYYAYKQIDNSPTET